jgi:Spy/CpxP family protein refolding chaperone
MKSDWKRTSTIFAGAGALIVAFAMLVMSQGPPRGGFRGGPGGPDGLGPLGRDLNLTDDQKAQIRKIHDSFASSTKELRDQLRAQHDSEPDPFSASFDEASVRSAAEARAKVAIELEVAHAKMMSQIGAVLTPDQKSQLAAKRERFGRRPPPPPQGQDQPEQDQ